MVRQAHHDGFIILWSEIFEIYFKIKNKNMNIKELVKQPEKLTGGHRLCAGCAAPIIVRLTLMAIEKPVVVINATCCVEVATTIYPFTAWRVPWIHNAFENSAATASGIVAAYNALRKKGEIKEETIFVVFAGDGGTYDIGLQSLSGALERGHKFLYVCYDNEAYMNTGNQRSGATPYGAATTTTPPGAASFGKAQERKNITQIVSAHNIPYVAQSSVSNFADHINKVQKAISADGPSFINAISPCQRSWKFDPSLSIEIARLAVETNFWPLYEIENGKYKINYFPRKKIPVADWIKKQGRFSHLLTKENEPVLAHIQARVDEEWEKLNKLAAC